MVGVPGRSKGCNTCRKRRVKCDEGRPICQRCIKGAFDCLGYERELLWRNTSTVPFPEPATSGPGLRNEMMVVLQRTTAASRVESPSPPPELSLVAFQDNIYHAFMFANHVWRSSGVLWLEQAARGGFGQLSLNATHALSQANFGRSHHQSDIELQGIALYGQSLKALAGQLASVNQNPQLIVPILVLLTHAGSQGDRTGAVFHLRGLARLLHLCGPTAFQQQPLLNAFEAARATMVVAALIGKQRLFLDAEHWRTVPWALNAVFKTPQSELLDIIIVLPGILHDHAALDASHQSQYTPYRELLERVKTQLVILYRWRWRWQAKSGHEVCIESGNASMPKRILGQLGRLRFHRFVAASELMLYNATLMWLLSLMFKLDPLGAAQHIEGCAAAVIPPDDRAAKFASFQPLRRPGAAVTVRDPAIEICRAFEWVTRHHDYSKEPTFLYLFPVSMAMTVLRDDPEGIAWVTTLLNVSPVTASYAQGENQAGFGFYLNREPLLAPEMVQAKEPYQLFSQQDVQQLGA